MIPPVVAKGNQNFVAGKKHLSLGLMGSTAANFCSCYVLAGKLSCGLPKHSLTLSDIRELTVTIVCAPCNRRGRYSVARLLEDQGDARVHGGGALLAFRSDGHSCASLT